MTVNKVEQKIYYSHSGYPGGLKEVPAKRLRANKSDWMIREAGLGMLPKNKLRAGRAEKLRIYRDAAGVGGGRGGEAKSVVFLTFFLVWLFLVVGCVFCGKVFGRWR